MDDDLVTLVLCGDVMTGRGIGQILPHPGDPRLREAYIPAATGYVVLAEAANGPIPARWNRHPTVCSCFGRPLADGSGQAPRW